MAKSNNILGLFKTLLPLEDFLYLYQLADYYPGEYLKILPRFFFRRNIQKRDQLKKTSYIKLVLPTSSFLMLLATTFVLLASWPIILKVFFLFLFLLLVPIFVFVGIILSKPFQLAWSYYVCQKVAKKVKEINPKIIAITGSFGKTTVKNFVFQLIQHNFQTLMPEGNINTADGIANWIIKNLSQGTDCLVLEMGAYTKGEIKKSCFIAPPDIAVITSLGDQHLSHFGSFNNLVKTKLEIFEFAKNKAVKIIPNKYKKDIKNIYSLKTISPEKDLIYLGKSLKAPTNLLFSQLENLKIALKVAEILKIPLRFVKDSIAHLEIPNRRSQLKRMHGYSVIDDSYNISLETGKRGVRMVLKLLKGRKLVVVTAGIPEAGIDVASINKQYGKFLAENADFLVVLKSIFSKDLLSGFKKGKGESEVVVLRTYKKAWEKIK